MITIYLKQYNKIVRNADLKLFDELGYDDVLWIDLFSPTIQEQKAVENFMEINLLTRQQAEEIESTSKYYETENAIFSNANFFVPTSDGVTVEPVSFIVSEGVLITNRSTEFRTFNEAAKRLQMNNRAYPTGYHLLISILEVRIDADADLVESVSKQIASLSREITVDGNVDKGDITRINTLQEQTMLIRENIFDRQRVLSGIQRSERFPNDIYPRLQLMVRDVKFAYLARRFQFRASGLPPRYRIGSDKHRTKQYHKDLYRGIGLLSAGHADSKHLWYELQGYARVGYALRLPICVAADGYSFGFGLPLLQA